MEMKEFGCNNEKRILLIHGAGATYKMWTAQIEVLEKEYHLYVPTLNGHVIGQNKEYIAPPQEAGDIVEWFEKHDIQKINMIAGASLGAYVASEVLRLRPDFAEYALIESLKSYHYRRFMTRIFLVLGEKMLRKAAGVEGVMDGSYQKDYISDDMKYVLSNMTKTSLHNVLLTAANYRVPDGERKITAKTLIVYGSKEEKLCKENTEIFEKQIVECKCHVVDGYNHGELSIGNPMEHVKMLKMWMENGMVECPLPCGES